MGMPGDVDGFRNWYRTTLDEILLSDYWVREPIWTECVAVGSRSWVKDLSSQLVAGRKSIYELSQAPSTVAEEETSYGLSASRRAADSLLLWSASRQNPGRY
jgi:hypothetical protein